MKVVVLDGFTLNPGDLSWDSLYAVGSCEVFDRTTKEDLLIRAYDAAILLTNKTPLRTDSLASLPSLKYIDIRPGQRHSWRIHAVEQVVGQ